MIRRLLGFVVAAFALLVAFVIASRLGVFSPARP